MEFSQTSPTFATTYEAGRRNGSNVTLKSPTQSPDQTGVRTCCAAIH
jgi:hypothetical protein